MAHREFTFGALVRLRVQAAQDGVLVDPTEVTIIIEEPDKVEVTETYNGGTGNVQKEETGIYFFDYSADKAGTVQYRWKTTSPQGAKENYFVVPPSRVATP